MPGTPEEYTASDDYNRAKEMIDQAISQGATSGDAILSALSDGGLRVYGEGSVEAAPEEGMPEEMPEEGAMGEGMGEGMGEDMGDADAGPKGPPKGPGGQGLLIEAVRFGMEEDKKKKDKYKKERGE